jgi:DNA polymerase-3 subunit gamma/tau
VAYISLYRKYRAQDFEELLGQSHVTVTLRNAIQQGRLAHAYLFCGPRGTGKTSTARLLAKSLNCEQGPTPTPCKVCRFCRAIQEGNCVDVVEMDAASETSIDDVRTSIIENAKYPPMEARYKIYIIDEVHDLSAKAFDALLKTIEEPPPHVVFILATTEFHRVPPTIRSRCQRFDFHRGTIADITRRLEQVLAAEGFTAEPAALHLVARAADGSWRDALTALEQVIAFSEGGTITAQTVYNALGLLEDETLMQLTDALLERDAGRALQLLEGQMLLGREPRVFAESLIQHWRALIQAALHAHDRVGRV